MAASNRMRIVNEEENLQLAFKYLDKNGDGKIDIDEIKEAIAPTTTGSLEHSKVDHSFWIEMMQEIDKDGNGTIEYNEFRDHMREMIEKGAYDRRNTPASASRLISRDDSRFDIDRFLMDD